MTASSTGSIERVARVLAQAHLNRDAARAAPAAGSDVDSLWPQYRSDAVAVLNSLRNAPPEVAALGISDSWERGMDAALGRGGESSHHDDDSSLGEVAKSARHFLRAPS